MASRTAQRRESAERLRQALADAERQAAGRRRRRNAGLVTVAAALLVVAAAIALGGGEVSPRSGAADGRGAVADATYSSRLLAGIPQHGLVLGDPRAPARMVEFADLQCPYCDEFATQALPQLIARYVRPGKLSIEFRNLAFIGPDSVRAARAAAGAEQQNRLWNFVELMYCNQGQENTGYVTGGYLHRLLAAIPGLDVARAERASRTAAASAPVTGADAVASAYGINATPSFLIGGAGGPLRLFQPGSLTAGAFAGALDRLIGARG